MEYRGYVPNTVVFNRLIACTNQSSYSIRDIKAGYSATAKQLLSDVVFLRGVLGDVTGEYIPLLAPGSYDYAVGFLAILACSAIIVPVSTAYPVTELRYFVEKVGAKRILVHHEFISVGMALQKLMPMLVVVDIGQALNTSLKDIFITPGDEADYNKPGLVIFTSGTTGPPKGCVQRLGILNTYPQTLINYYNIQATDVVMHCLPVHHATGILVTFIPFLHAGACVEFHPGFDTKKTWDRWLEGGLSYFSGVPTMFMRMARYLDGVIEKQPYVEATRQFKAILCGTSGLPRPVEKQWLELTGGKRFFQRYGATEFGAVVLTPLDQSIQLPDGSSGILIPGVDMRLSDEGEVLVRKPPMFLGYIGDEKATAEAFEGDFFKTGDIARREGKFLFVMGRKSIDIIKSGGYKISALDVERELLSLDYIIEAMVVPVGDEEYGQKVAAAVITDRVDLAIDQLRSDLEDKLARYKLPTLLRVVPELPKTATGKVIKKPLRDLFFDGSSNVQEWKSSKL